MSNRDTAKMAYFQLSCQNSTTENYYTINNINSTNSCKVYKGCKRNTVIMTAGLRVWIRLHYSKDTRFNCVFSRTTWVSRLKEGYTNLDFNEERDDGVAVASAGPHANHLHLAPDRQSCQYLTTQFLQAGCPSCCPTNSVEALHLVADT